MSHRSWSSHLRRHPRRSPLWKAAQPARDQQAALRQQRRLCTLFNLMHVQAPVCFVIVEGICVRANGQQLFASRAGCAFNLMHVQAPVSFAFVEGSPAQGIRVRATNKQLFASSAGWLFTWRLLLDGAPLPIGDVLAQSPNGWHPGGAVSIAAQVRALQ